MFGIDFDGFDDGTGLGLRPLLLPEGFEGTPLRKSFVLAARASKAWPGAKEPGEGHDSGPRAGPSARAGARRARPRVGAAMSDLAPWLEVVLRAVAVLAAFLVLPLLVGQTEHKVMAHMQGRLGPMYAGGFHGWAQLVADGVKFVQKEDITPARADRWVFRLAPFVALIPYLVALAVIPLSPTVVGADVDASACSCSPSSGSASSARSWPGGPRRTSTPCSARCARPPSSCPTSCRWCSPSPPSRSPPGSLSLVGIAEAWNPWWLLWQLPGAVVFLVAALAELQRPPFDMPLADSEIVFGAFTEYTGLRFAFFLLAEYAGIVVMSLLFAVLYLGGWSGPVRAVARLAVDRAQGLPRRGRRHLAARLVAAHARGPAPAPRLGLARADRAPPARDHRRRRGGDDP